jgi:hypothetical protein
MKIKRRQLLVHREVQIKLMMRIFVYWALFMLTTSAFVYAWFARMTPHRTALATWNDLLFQYGPVALMTFILVPILMCDMLRLSNRFLGPMVRLQRQLRRLAEGQPAEAVYFREGDLWNDFADDFNRLVARISPAKDSTAAGNAPIQPRTVNDRGGDSPPQYTATPGQAG